MSENIIKELKELKELKEHVIILENRLNDIGYHYFLLTNDEFELSKKGLFIMRK